MPPKPVLIETPEFTPNELQLATRNHGMPLEALQWPVTPVGLHRFKRNPDDPGEPVKRMRPRALMVPPGIPDFMTRRRFVSNGPVEVMGRAWSGLGPVVTVAVSADGGGQWHEAALEPPVGHHAWRGWSWTWTPPGPNDYELRCRARDASGAEQPITPAWNLKGYANTAVQQVPVTVRSPEMRPSCTVAVHKRDASRVVR